MFDRMPGTVGCGSNTRADRCDVAVAMEGVLTGAIAGAEKSVVAIARVRRNDRDDISPLELRPDPLGRFQIQQDPRPGDPEFIPNEYATGVVVDRRGLILTNFHVLGEESDLYVTTADRRVYPAKIWAGDAAQRFGRLVDRCHRSGADPIRRRQ